MKYGLKIIFCLSYVILLGLISTFAQNQFNFESVTPTESSLTSVDFFSVSTKFNITLPLGIKPNEVKTDTEEKKSGYIISRQIKIVKRDDNGIPTYQVTYIPPDKINGISLPNDEVNFPVFSKLLQDRVFEFNCKDEAVVEVKNEEKNPITEEAEFVIQECLELKKNTLKKSFFSGMKVGDSKEYLTTTTPSLLSDNFSDLGMKKLKITLSELNGEAVKTAKFKITGKIDSGSSLGDILQDCEGTLVLDEKGMSMELNLKCSSKEPSKASLELLKLPGDSEFKIIGETNITYLRKLL